MLWRRTIRVRTLWWCCRHNCVPLHHTVCTYQRMHRLSLDGPRHNRNNIFNSFCVKARCVMIMTYPQTDAGYNILWQPINLTSSLRSHYDLGDEVIRNIHLSREDGLEIQKVWPILRYATNTLQSIQSLHLVITSKATDVLILWQTRLLKCVCVSTCATLSWPWWLHLPHVSYQLLWLHVSPPRISHQHCHSRRDVVVLCCGHRWHTRVFTVCELVLNLSPPIC